MAHGQWTEIEARGVLEAWKKSGMGLEKYARARGLVPQRLYWWKKKLGLAAATRAKEAALVPVRIAERPTETIAESRRGEPVTVLLRSGHKGVPVARSTMNELLHRASALLAPVWTRLLDVIRHRDIVLADETRLRIMKDASGKPKTGFVWTFVAADAHGGTDVAYHFAESHSGSTPRTLLEGTKGVLLVDGYSGYNDVEKVSSRRRAACFAHVRRYFFESLRTAPVAQEALDLITELYRVEHDAKEQRLSESSHLELRKQRARPIRDRIKTWLDDHAARHPPKSPLGVAIRYTQGQWNELGVFLDDARVPLDNNASERALRRIALGRKNYLFVGDVAAGKSSSPPARRVGSTRSTTSSISSAACRITRPARSTSCCPARGPRSAERGARRRRPDGYGSPG